ncbi:MAG: SUMF1/EgtB/PvdO family nonheme iron enzyme [Candidatus Sericytochromatia bacterium]
MKTNKISKTVLAVSLLFTSFSCSVNPTSSLDITDKSQIKNQENQGIIVINLADIFSSQKHKFSIKRYKFDDSLVEEIKIGVYSTDASGNASFDSNGMLIPETERVIKRGESISEVFLSVNAGKNKVVMIQTFDNKKVELSRLMSALNVFGGKKTTLNVNYGTYPTAEILMRLMESATLSDRKLAYSLDLANLEGFINSITAYDINSNTYGAINPSFLDLDTIITNIKTNRTTTSDAGLPMPKGDIKAYRFISSSDNIFSIATNVISNDPSDTTPFTFSGNMAVGDVIFIKERDTVTGAEMEYQCNVTAVGANSVTVDRNFTTTNKEYKTISYPDRKKYDNELKGKIRYTVKNSTGTILKGVKFELNDLTAENVSSSTEDSTIIENISAGTWLLRVTAYDGGKTLQWIETIQIKAGQTYIEKTIVPVENKVSSIRFENLNNNVNTPVPTNIDLASGYSILVKAIVTMDDGSENQNITWTSSDSNIASVSGGTISASKAGTVTITAAATDNLAVKKTINVTVTQNQSEGPMITSFSPTASGTDTEVLIKGDRFDDASLTSTNVRFNGVQATVLDVKKTEIKVKVPTGATTGKISITTSKGTFISQDYFIINSPTTGDTTGMVFIPSTDIEGFYMGYSGSDTDNFYPRHKVVLNSYHIDRTEVTNEQFEQFINAGGYTNDSLWSSEGLAFRNSNNLNNSLARPSYWLDTRFNQPKQPVVGISFYEAEAYANWKGRRLPTEAEWEYAARGKDERIFPWGGDAPAEGNKKANGFFGTLGNGDDYQFTNEVGKFTNGDSPFGLKDMSGNAYEWVSDYYDPKYYTTNQMENPKGPSIGGSKVLRGGSWFNHPYFGNDTTKMTDSLKTYSRFFSSPANRSNYIGFRTAR